MKIPCLLPEDGQPLQIQSKVYMIGRAQKSHLVIDHPSISKEHSQFLIQDKNYIQDMNSVNGTYVNSVRLGKQQQMEINDGDIIQFGKYPILYTFYSDTRRAYQKKQSPVIKDMKISVLDYVKQRQQLPSQLPSQSPIQQQNPIQMLPQTSLQSQQQIISPQIQDEIMMKNMETAQNIIKQLERENGDLRTQIQIVQKDIDIQKQQYLEQQFKYEKQQQDHSMLQTKYDSIEPIFKDLQNKLEQFKKENEILKSDIEELKVTDVGKKISLMTNEINQLRKILLIRDEENTQLKKQISQLLTNVSGNPQHHVQMIEQNIREMTQMKKIIQEWEQRDNECNRKWTALLKDNAQKDEQIRGLKFQIDRQITNLQSLYQEYDVKNHELNKRILNIIENQDHKDAALFLVQQMTVIQEERRIFAAENEDLHKHIQELITELEIIKKDEYLLQDGVNVTQLIVALRQRIEELNDILNEYKQRDSVDQLVSAKHLVEDLELKLLNSQRRIDKLEQNIYTLKNTQSTYQNEGTFEYFTKRINDLEQLLKDQQKKINFYEGQDKQKELQIDNMKYQIQSLAQYDHPKQVHNNQIDFKNEKIIVS